MQDASRRVLARLKTCGICYGAYLCVFIIVAALGKVQRWNLGFFCAFLAGGALLFGVSRFASYYDRHPAPEPSPDAPPEPEDKKAAWLRILDRWASLLWGILVALPPMLSILI